MLFSDSEELNSEELKMNNTLWFSFLEESEAYGVVVLALGARRQQTEASMGVSMGLGSPVRQRGELQLHLRTLTSQALFPVWY